MFFHLFLSRGKLCLCVSHTRPPAAVKAPRAQLYCRACFLPHFSSSQPLLTRSATHTPTPHPHPRSARATEYFSRFIEMKERLLAHGISPGGSGGAAAAPAAADAAGGGGGGAAVAGAGAGASGERAV